MSTTYLEHQITERARAWEAGKALLDSAAAENRDLSGEEQASWDAINADLDRRAEAIKDLQAAEAREAEIAKAVEGVRGDPVARERARDDLGTLRALARGEIRHAEFGPERRTVSTTSTGSPVPTSFYDQVIGLMRYVGPMLDVATVLTTDGGENLQIPSQATYSTGTVSSQSATIGTSDPTFNSFITLGAFKYSFLTKISAELLTDNGVDLLGFLAGETANALGYAVNTALTTGTGTVEPKGIVSAAGSGVTGSTAVSGAFTHDDLVDLVYSVDAAARRLPGFGIMMGGPAVGAVRKLKDGAGNYIFQPSLSESTPDRLLGFPLTENPAMAAVATSAKSVIAGHLPSYLVRQVGGIRLDRSDEFAFDADLVTFRAQIRVDGNLPQTSHVKYFIGGAS